MGEALFEGGASPLENLLVKSYLFVAASALVLATLTTPAMAQMHMPGMTMPMPAKHAVKKKAAARKKGATKATPNRKAVAKNKASARVTSKKTPAKAMQGMSMPTPAQPGAPASSMPMGQEMGQMNMPMGQSQMSGMNMQHGGHQMAMSAALGSYPAEREASGTSWQPDASRHIGLMTMSGDWMLMAHGDVNLVYDHQSGPRGDDKAFASGMLMGMAQRPLGNGTLQFKAMLSSDPLMGPSGYPLLLASGETANGRDRLIDRQHPHDLFMELAGSISQNIGNGSSVFLYAGLPGEPAFGPPAFMHRESIMDSPEAPITHHWLDSTHISFGVVTAGLVLDRVKVEVSRFNGREPDQHRWNIETGPLDSTAIRLSWNPTSTLALQGSWGHFVDPEQLEPDIDQKRWSASALWADDIAPGWHAAATLAWGRKSAQGHSDDGVALEGSLSHAQWTLFGRAEMTQNRELLDIENGPAFRVGKTSLGAIRDFPIGSHLSLGAGGLFSLNFVPDGLAPLYGGHNPTGEMAFLRLKLN